MVYYGWIRTGDLQIVEQNKIKTQPMNQLSQMFLGYFNYQTRLHGDKLIW